MKKDFIQTDYNYEEGAYDKLSDYFYMTDYEQKKSLLVFVLENVEGNEELKLNLLKYVYRKYRYLIDMNELMDLVHDDEMLLSIIDPVLLDNGDEIGLK